MYELKVKNDKGEVLNLSQTQDYIVYKVEGLAPPKSTIYSSVNAIADGSTINAVKVDSRNIVLYIAINSNVEVNRINLYKYFPVKKNITLYFTNETRKVMIDGVVELIECDLFNKRQVAQISLICPKAYFRDVDDFVSEFSDVSNLFEFPYSIDEYGIEFSAITTSLRKSIIYNGDIDTGIIIELFAVGVVNNPTLYNVETAEKMKFNFSMQTSDKLVINTNFGEKSVTLIRNGVSSNALGYLTPDSNWFKLVSGDNVFTYEAESGSSNLKIKFTSAVLYGGV